MRQIRSRAWQLLLDEFEGESLPHEPKILILANGENDFAATLKEKVSSLTLYFSSPYKTDFNVFKKVGFCEDAEAASSFYDFVLLVPGKQKIESLGLLSLAFTKLKDSGKLLLCVENDLGASSYFKSLKEIDPSIEIKSENKSKFSRIEKSKIKNLEILSNWAHQASPRFISETQYYSQPGVFGWNKVDRASELLLESLENLSGRGADLGSGYGFLSASVLKKYEAIERMDLFEVDQRALVASQRNLENWKNRCQFHWTDLSSEKIKEFENGFDFVLCNPPFHEGREVDLDLGKSFIRQASFFLKRGETFFLVANQFLSYENELEKLFKTFKKIKQVEGFKVIHAVK